MYRVELKDNSISVADTPFLKVFLMYRVELKGDQLYGYPIGDYLNVPNVPCGVESW